MQEKDLILQGCRMSVHRPVRSSKCRHVYYCCYIDSRNLRFNSYMAVTAVKSNNNKKKKLEGISLQWVQVSRLWQVVCFREDAMLFQAELCKHFLPSQNVFPRAGTLCLLKSLASVQKSILLENSHMQKWTCRIWSYKSNQSEKHRSCTTMEMRDRYYTGGEKPVRKG